MDQKKHKTLNDVIPSQSLNIIDIRDKEIMVNAMMKMVEDLNNIELLLSSLELKPDQVIRVRQFVTNNKIRARKVIWGLTISRIKDVADQSFTKIEEEIEQHRKMMHAKEEDDD